MWPCRSTTPDGETSWPLNLRWVLIPLALIFAFVGIGQIWGTSPYGLVLNHRGSISNKNANVTTFVMGSTTTNLSSQAGILSVPAPAPDIATVDQVAEHTIKDINERNRSSVSGRSRPIKKYSSLEILEAGLTEARSIIRSSSSNGTVPDPDFVPQGPMYINASAFQRSYMEMEKRLKVYMYEEGEPPIFHQGPGKGPYAVEGQFIEALQMSRFRTRDPAEALLFFLPFSVFEIVRAVYVPAEFRNWDQLRVVVKDYVQVVANKYPFWNRSLGSDHFMLACHDWGPVLSFGVLDDNSIRCLCNANTSEKFNPSRDVSIPEIRLPQGTTKGLLDGPSPSKRTTLVFFAGRMHGPVRPILLNHWENKDKDVQVHGELRKGLSYMKLMRQSKYCICASGYEVASPRMVEALYTGCVPVLIKTGYVIPFSDVLDWSKFAVIIPVEKIPDLKKILLGISQRRYLEMQRRGILVRRHFLVNSPPERYDVFHMILHSIWLRRLNYRIENVQSY